MGRFAFYLTNDRGSKITELSSGLGISGSKVANGVGWFNYITPSSFDRSIVKPDQMFQMWYAPDDGDLKLFNTYFLTSFDYEDLGFSFGGPDQNHLLTRRVVAAYSSDEDIAAIGDNVEADTIAREIVTASQSDSADLPSVYGDRTWSTFSVESVGSGQGPQISITFPIGQSLLTEDGGGALPAIAKAARERGTEIFYEVAPILGRNNLNFQFRVRLTKPGQDVSDKVTFDENTLIHPHLTVDHSREKNYIYAAGKGERNQRFVAQVYDAARIGQSIYGRKEGFADARNSENDAVEDVANAALYDGKPKIRFTGKPSPRDFGKTWWFGDIVTTKFQVIQFKSLIRAVTLSVDGDGVIDVDTRLDYES